MIEATTTGSPIALTSEMIRSATNYVSGYDVVSWSVNLWGCLGAKFFHNDNIKLLPSTSTPWGEHAYTNTNYARMRKDFADIYNRHGM
jgi:hypothetical protein